MQFFFKCPQPKQEATASSIQLDDKTVPLLFIHNPRSKRYIFRIRPDGTARVTIPRRGSLKAAREFAEKNAGWLQRQLERLATRPVRNTAWQIGTEILFRGEVATIAAGVVKKSSLTFADQTVQLDHDVQDLRPAIERHLHRLASIELPPKVFLHAQQNDLKVQRVTVRNQKSRWGSCSRRATISLNWRLIQAPEFVSNYIILHELMHLRQMNHSQKFWREVEVVCPSFREAERWLKQQSSMLR